MIIYTFPGLSLFPEKPPPHKNNEGGDGNNRKNVSGPIERFGGKSEFINRANALFTGRAPGDMQRKIHIAIRAFLGHVDLAFLLAVTIVGHGECSL